MQEVNWYIEVSQKDVELRSLNVLLAVPWRERRQVRSAEQILRELKITAVISYAVYSPVHNPLQLGHRNMLRPVTHRFSEVVTSTQGAWIQLTCLDAGSQKIVQISRCHTFLP